MFNIKINNMENNKTQYRKLTFEEMKKAYKEKYGVEWIKPDKDYSKETRKMIKTLDNLK